MLTQKDYCDYDTCVALMELGFPRWFMPYGILSEKYLLRLYDAQKWLREEKDIHVVPELGLIHRNKNGLITHYYRVLVKNMNSGIIITLDNDRDDFESYEEALLEGVRASIKILQDEQKENN